MYEEHEDGSFTLHMCEWYEQGRRLVGEYETLGDGSGFAVTDEWSTCSKVVVNHPLTRPDGTVMPGISRLRRFDWKVGPDEGLHADDYEIWERELREQAERDRDEPVPAVRAGADADDVPHIVSFSYGRGRMPRPPSPPQQEGSDRCRCMDGGGVPVGTPAPGKGPSTRRRAWDGPRRVRRRGAA